jgi:hypothetical protein
MEDNKVFLETLKAELLHLMIAPLGIYPKEPKQGLKEIFEH